MAYGLTDTEYSKLLGVLQRNAHVERAILYGSRAKGNYKPFSDIDLTLVGSQLSHADRNKIAMEIDDLLLPYQTDLSLFHTLKNPALIDHIKRRGVTIFDKHKKKLGTNSTG